jgi:hypothetical protein
LISYSLNPFVRHEIPSVVRVPVISVEILAAHLIMTKPNINNRPSEPNGNVTEENPSRATPRCGTKQAHTYKRSRETKNRCKQRKINLLDAIPIKGTVPHPLEERQGQHKSPNKNAGREQHQSKPPCMDRSDTHLGLTVLLGQTLCTASCTIDFYKWLWLAGFMKADLRISIKDYRRNKNLKVLLFRPPFPSRGFMVWMTRLR